MSAGPLAGEGPRDGLPAAADAPTNDDAVVAVAKQFDASTARVKGLAKQVKELREKA